MVSPRQFRAVLRFGLPLIPADLGRFAITYADHFLIRRFVDLRWTGIYSLSYQFGILLSIFVTQSFIRSWHVKRFELLKMGKEKDVSLKVFLYFHFVLLFFALLLSALIRDVVRVMLHPDFYDVHLLVPLIVLGYILQAPYYFFDFGIYIEKKTSYFSFILLSTAGINIALNLILIPAVHATGAAVATDISLLYMTLSCYFISRRFYSLPYEFGKVLAMFLIALPLFLLSLLFRVESIPLSILLNLAISLAYPPIILFSGLLPGEAKAAVLRWIRGSGVKLN